MSWPRQALIDLLGIEHPIIQAPMAGASTAALAAAVSNVGALGGFGGTDSSPGRTARGHQGYSSEDRTSPSSSTSISIAPSLMFPLPSARPH